MWGETYTQWITKWEMSAKKKKTTSKMKILEFKISVSKTQGSLWMGSTANQDDRSVGRWDKVYVWNPSPRKVEAGRMGNSRLALTTWQVSGQPGPHRQGLLSLLALEVKIPGWERTVSGEAWEMGRHLTLCNWSHWRKTERAEKAYGEHARWEGFQFVKYADKI